MSEDKPVFGTVGFYEALADTMNNDAKWLEMATPITYSMVYKLEAPIDKRFFMRFEKGAITEIDELAPGDERHVDFTFSGKPEVWAAVIKKEMTPTSAMATGKLKVDGPQTVLLRQMRKFAYLNEKMASMDAVFP